MCGLTFNIKDFEEVTLGDGYDLGNRYYRNEVLSYAVGIDGDVLGISIWEKSLNSLNYYGISRIEIGFGEVNVWVGDSTLLDKGLDSFYIVVKGVLKKALGKENVAYLYGKGDYKVTVGLG